MHNSTYIFQPYLIKESAHGYTPITLETELLNNQRKIFLTEEINTQSAISVIKQLMVLDSSDDPSPIKLYISSPGGSVADGLAIGGQRAISLNADVEQDDIGEPRVLQGGDGIRTLAADVTTYVDAAAVLSTDVGANKGEEEGKEEARHS